MQFTADGAQYQINALKGEKLISPDELENLSLKIDLVQFNYGKKTFKVIDGMYYSSKGILISRSGPSGEYQIVPESVMDLVLKKIR